jgi:hypothetical protein
MVTIYIVLFRLSSTKITDIFMVVDESNFLQASKNYRSVRKKALKKEKFKGSRMTFPSEGAQAA